MEQEKEKVNGTAKTFEKSLKSKAKAAGVKSVFGFEDRVVTTSFGRGNDAIIEKVIEKETIVPKHDPEAYRVDGMNGKKLQVTGTRMIRSKDGDPHSVSANPDLPRARDDVYGVDQIGAKGKLEERYFGKTFKDNLHIQIIYNILDIEKILTSSVNSIVCSLNNLQRKDAEEQDMTDLFKSCGLRISFDKFVKKKNDYSTFHAFCVNPRLRYFGRAFVRVAKPDELLESGKQRLKEKNPVLLEQCLQEEDERQIRKYGDGDVLRNEREIYSIISLLSEARHACVHDFDKSEEGRNLGRAFFYNLDEYLEENENPNEKSNEIANPKNMLNWIYSEKLEDLRKLSNTYLTNNFPIVIDALNIDLTTEAGKKKVRDYYAFAFLKNYKNLGFSVKQLRELLAKGALAERFDRIPLTYRGKLTGILDFLIADLYCADENRLETFTGNLRTAFSEDQKEALYIEEAAWIGDTLKEQFETVFSDVHSLIEKTPKFRRLEENERKIIFNEIQKVSPKEEVRLFSKLIYLFTMLLDGKEINDLLTTLINRFDNIFSLLKVLRTESGGYEFADPYKFFNYDVFTTWRSNENADSTQDEDVQCVVLEELKAINGFARMTKVDNPKAKADMYRDAVLLLGLTKQEKDHIDEYLKSFLDKEKTGTGFRNFLANNVIESRRFRYVIRFINPDSAKTIMRKEKLVRFVFRDIPDTQIDRYVASCGKEFDSREEKVSFLVTELLQVNAERFRDVNQSANAENNAKKKSYTVVLSLYLNVLYQIVKNLVNVNSRYMIAFHSLERDGRLLLGESVDHDNGNQTELSRKIVGDRRAAYEEKVKELSEQKGKDGKYFKQFVKKNRVLDDCERSLESCDEVMIADFRNSVAHLGAIRNAARLIKDPDEDLDRFNSYFEIYHYLIQKNIVASFEHAKEKGWIVERDGAVYYQEKDSEKQINPLSLKYLENVKKHRTYCKDFVKALCAPFIYNLARYKSLSVDILFDRNEKRETKRESERRNKRGE